MKTNLQTLLKALVHELLALTLNRIQIGEESANCQFYWIGKTRLNYASIIEVKRAYLAEVKFHLATIMVCENLANVRYLRASFATQVKMKAIAFENALAEKKTDLALKLLGHSLAFDFLSGKLHTILVGIVVDIPNTWTQAELPPHVNVQSKEAYSYRGISTEEE